jgi:Virulence protein RhuM family
MFLDYAEDQAKRRKQFFLKDWKTKLDEFLKFNERRVLPDADEISREATDEKAIGKYQKFSELHPRHISRSLRHPRFFPDPSRRHPTQHRPLPTHRHLRHKWVGTRSIEGRGNAPIGRRQVVHVHPLG